ncbi:MAG: hypothetical protein K8M05_39150, partial [Deltaproteobacteria bacterium]|nr:hypothetical protein [Kofleriaceae bacterium]
LHGDAARRTAGVDRSTLRVRLERRGHPPIEVVRGAAVPESGQLWLAVDGRAVLVPAWVGAALDRDLASLRRRQVFPPVAITGVEIHGLRNLDVVGGAPHIDLVLAGSPLRRRDDGASVRVAREAVAAFDAALASIVLDVFVAGDTSLAALLRLGRPRLTVRVLGGAAPHELVVRGPCPGHPSHALVGGSAGTGCVSDRVLRELEAAALVLSTSSATETALAPAGAAEIDSIRAGSGASEVVLARRGAGWLLTLGDERVDADDDAVKDFFEVLAEPGRLHALPPGAPSATWTVTLAGGSVETWRWYARRGEALPLVRRDDEPQAIELRHGNGGALRRFGPPLRNLTLLVVDAAMVNGIRATGLHPATLARGQLVGDWTVTAPAGKTAAPAAQALVELLAGFRGAAWLEPRELGAIRRTLTFTIDAPPIPGGQPSTHTIAVGAARGAACAVRVDQHLPVEIPAAACAALTAPLAQ